MIHKWGGTTQFVLLALAIGFPALLLVHAWFSGRELDRMRSIFLRDRAAGIAARLETVPPDEIARNDFEQLFDAEPSLIAVQVFRPADPDGGDADLAAVRSGRSLYRTAQIGAGHEAVFRAWIPFHSAGEVNVARIDLSPSAPDFILVHARHNLLIAIGSGAALLLVSLFAIWSTARRAELERRQLENERLAQIGTLSAVLAHEIRNPLGAIKGFAQLARESADAAKRKPLDAIVRESLRLEALVNSLLLYGRPVEPKVRAVDWAALAADLAAHVREAIGTRPIEFASRSDLKALSTDPDLLKQALLNLVRNAIEAIPEGRSGSVTLSAAAAPGGTAVIAVEDDGPGIPEGVRAKLFSPFVTGKPLGTGLGLAIAKKVVESLGGSLRIVSREPHGTRAEMRFHGTTAGC
jgi:two-component system sensor histidine kinase HydH